MSRLSQLRMITLATLAGLGVAAGAPAIAWQAPAAKGRPAPGAESEPRSQSKTEADPEPEPPRLDRALRAVVDRHNAERAEAGLPPLKVNAQLVRAAERHALDMASRGRAGHDGSDDSDPAARIAAAGFRGMSSGENVAAGQKNAKEVVQAWMDSPPHRENILRDFNALGVARELDADKRPYWCVTFGKTWPKLEPSKAEADLAAGIQAARAEAGKPKLTVDRHLAEAARRHARDQAARNGAALALEKANGKAEEKADAKAEEKAPEPIPFPRVDGPRRTSMSLSVTSGPTDADAALDALTADDGQKANLLGTHKSLGVGYASADDGRPYWVVLFATP